jgi:NarL family two-component system sensor histidine kinase LiaS
MQLSAARTSMSATDKAYQSVTEAERLAQQAGSELTTLIQELRPPSLERKSLPVALREHVEDWSRQNKIEAQINLDESVSVELQAEQALFRVLQEALANVARHSQASRIEVTLKSEKENVILKIEDDGIGFDASKIVKGVGLDSMQERLAAMNGNLEVSSRKSKGTRVTATVRSA